MTSNLRNIDSEESEEKRQKFEEFKLANKEKIEAWLKDKPKHVVPPIVWDEKGEFFYWQNRKSRRLIIAG